MYKDKDKQREYSRKWAAKRRLKYPEKFQNYKMKARKKLRLIILERKKQPCVDCGNSFPPQCMDFDHREPHLKEFNIADFYDHGTENVKAELDKCDVVCANCHRLRTFPTIQFTLENLGE